MTRLSVRAFVFGLLVGVPLTSSAIWLNLALPAMWPEALARPIVALGRHGDPLVALAALAGTIETLLVAAWRYEPFVFACAALNTSFAAYFLHAAYVSDAVQAILARLVVSVRKTMPTNGTGVDRGP